MTAWTSVEFNRIGNAEELQIASQRRDGTLRNPVIFWVVRIGNDLYVRSVKGRSGGLYRKSLLTRKESIPMSTEENQEIVRRYFDERWNHHNLDICDELLAPSDIEDAKEFVRSFHATFGNMRLTILDLLAEGNQVAIRWRVEGTHQGDYLGVAATSKPVTYQGIALLRVEDGKIVDDIAYWDNLSILQQIGAAPE